MLEKYIIIKTDICKYQIKYHWVNVYIYCTKEISWNSIANNVAGGLCEMGKVTTVPDNIEIGWVALELNLSSAKVPT